MSSAAIVWSRTGIRTKLILGVAFVHLVLMTGFVFDLVERQKEFLLNELTQRAIRQADMIAVSASSWVIADDLIGMEEILQSSAQDRILKYAAIVGPDGRVLAHTDQGVVGKYLSDDTSRSALGGERGPRIFFSNEHTIHAVAPIIVEGEVLGWAMLALDKSATIQHLRYVTHTGVLYTLVALIIGTIFATLLARSILRQLQHLLEGVDRLGANVLEPPVPVVSADEVGRVATAFNSVLGSLKETRSRLDGEITRRRNAEEDIRKLLQRQIGLIEDDRKRISRDLHDELGQALSGIQFGLKALESGLPASERVMAQKCHELVGMVETIGDAIHRIASDLRPAILDHLGLVPAVEAYVDEHTRRIPGLEINFQAVGFRSRPNPEVELAAYRIIQESLTNIVKHARARRAEVLLTISHPKLIIVIRDDGLGIEWPLASAANTWGSGGLGLLGMKERASSVGGDLEIRSDKGRGSLIRVELPVAQGTMHV